MAIKDGCARRGRGEEGGRGRGRRLGMWGDRQKVKLKDFVA